MRSDLTQKLHEAIDQLIRVFKISEGQISDGEHEIQLNPAEILTLVFVGRNPDCMASNVARHLDVAPTTASSIIDRLVRRGFLLRERPEHNRRVVKLRLTVRGLNVKTQIVDEQLANCATMLKVLPAKERAVFVQLISKIASAVSPPTNQRLKIK